MVREAISVRPERPDEFDKIRELVRIAFLDADHAEGDEHEFVDRQRAGAGYIPELALVAEAKGVLIGHLMLTSILVQTPQGDQPTLLLAELAVASGFRRQGVASRLIARAAAQARDAGHTAIVLVGDPAFYERFGFRSANEHGLRNSNGIEPQYFLSHELRAGGLLHLTGTAVLPQ